MELAFPFTSFPETISARCILSEQAFCSTEFCIWDKNQLKCKHCARLTASMSICIHQAQARLNKLL